MAKKIYNSFLGGLSSSDRSSSDNSYFIGREVDPYRENGYIMPAWTTSELSGMDTVTNLVTDFSDVEPGGGNNVCYAIDSDLVAENGCKLYSIDTDTDTITTKSSIASNGGRSVLYYDCKKSGTSSLDMFYIQKNTMGRKTGSSTYDDDWLSSVPTGGAGLQPLYRHPYLIWKTYLFIGNTSNIGKLDGQTGSDGTWTADAFDLGGNWEITALFPTSNYIGICATQKEQTIFRTSDYKTKSTSKIFFWDGSSSTFTYSFPVQDNIIEAAINDNGNIRLFTHGRQEYGVIRELISRGTKTISIIRHDIDGTITNIDIPRRQGAVDIYKGRIVFGSSDQNAIMSYGNETENEPNALTFPFASITSSSSEIGAIKAISNNKLYVSYKKGTNYYVSALKGGYSPNSQWKGNYTDAGQRIRINYVKYYFKPLVLGDSVTVSLDSNYGTPNTLGTISYSADGAVTEKIFRKQITCHSFRPVIDWSAGGVAFSKVVIDYDFISD